MADPKKIDTGTGGFPIDGNRYTYATGDSTEELMGRKVNWSAGDIRVSQTVEDLSPTVKKTLASYLSETTRGKTPSSPSAVSNAYPIQHNSSLQPTDLSFSTKEGYTASPGGMNDEQPQFEKSRTLGDERSKAIPNLRRGREKPVGQAQLDGHTLLKDFVKSDSKTPAVATAEGFNKTITPKLVADVPAEHPIRQYYGEPGLSDSMIYNRFNPDAKFGQYVAPGAGTVVGTPEPDPGSLGSRDSRITHLTNPQFEKPRGYQLGKSTAFNKVRGVSYGVLAQVGVALTMRSGAELGSFGTDYNPTNTAATAAALLPGSAQLGLDRIERDLLRAGNVIADLGGESIDYRTILIDPAAKSWGTLNNVNDEFSGISSFGMQALSAALMVTVLTSIGLLIGTFSLFKSKSTAAKVDSTKRYAPGQYERKYSSSSSSDALHTEETRWLLPGSGNVGGFDLISQLLSGNVDFKALIGIQRTVTPLEGAVTTGLLASFGVTNVTSTGFVGFNFLGNTLASIAKQTAKSPGYYAVLARAINRSILQIGDSFLKIGSAFASVFTNPLKADFVGLGKQILSVIETLRDSKIMKIINSFAQLGDKININSVEALERKKKLAAKDAVSANTTYDLGVIDPVANPHVTRAWSVHRAPDMFVLPSSLGAITSEAAKALNAPSMDHTVKKSSLKYGGIYGKSNPAENSDRISTEDREKFEDVLESEYVPFYIHDVRTNEIVSFHAFLASLSDSYTASYDPIEGMGRVESGKIYKSTNRKLDFSFWLVSTSPEDFDSMWLKINKLTTLLYPQYSKGRTIADEKNSMFAPFSQLIQASPLVRVRIGDLVKSNYSKFNLARTFGYAEPGTAFDGKFSPNTSETSLNNQLFQDKLRKEEANPTVGTKWRLNSVFKAQYLLDNDPSVVADLTFIENEPIPSNILFKILEVNPASSTATIIAVKDENAPPLIPVPPDPLTFPFLVERGFDRLLKIKLKVPINFLSITPEHKGKIKEEVDKNTPGYADKSKYNAAAVDFMSSDEKKGNVIVRSFRSAGGKGLAGFIESMQFEWPTDKQWEVGRGVSESDSRLGRRAPMVCKVTVNFAPVHDITPGLDHRGANRAPIYSVGSMAFDDMYSVKGK